MSVVLEAREIGVRYGGMRAVADVSVAVSNGEIVGLIGPNGAGKTSFLDAVTGFVACEGSVSVNGAPVDHLKPHQRARAGIRRTFQEAELFDDLTVRGNLEVVTVRPGPFDLLIDAIRPGRRLYGAEHVDDALRRVGIAELAEVYPPELTVGQRKLVGVARALSGGSAVLVLDEPAAGLDTTESAEFGERLLALRDDGLAILLVDHDMELILSVSDRVVVMNFGEVIGTGTPAVIRDDPVVRAAYLGDDENDLAGDR